MEDAADTSRAERSAAVGHLDLGEEHRSWAPLRTVFPDHEDFARWSWVQATRSPDTGAIVQAYKLLFVGTLWVDDVGRIYRYESPSPRLLPQDRRVELLHELLRLMRRCPDALPRLIRLVPPDASAADLQDPVEVVGVDPTCDGCRNEVSAGLRAEVAGDEGP